MQHQTPPCCICYVQKENKSIIQYRCKGCQEGNVCDQCAIKLWTSNAGGCCPICRKETEGRNTWYKSYDIEMGQILPPHIDNNIIIEIDNNNISMVERIVTCICSKDNLAITSIMAIFLLFISFIIGTLFKSLTKQCAWQCANEPVWATIITSIGFGIIGIPIVVLCLTIASIIWLSIINLIKMFCSKIKYQCDRFAHWYRDNNATQDIKKFCTLYCKKTVYYFSAFVFTILASWGVGTLHKLANNWCYWDCSTHTNLMSFATSVMIGFPILMLSAFCLFVSGLCFIMCISCCIDLGTNKHQMS